MDQQQQLRMKKWRVYQDLSQAIKQVPKGDMLLAMGDINAKVGRREPSAMSSAVGLYGLGETNEAGEQLEDFCLEHELAPVNTMFKQHPRRLYTWTSADGNTRNQTTSELRKDGKRA